MFRHAYNLRSGLNLRGCGLLALVLALLIAGGCSDRSDSPPAQASVPLGHGIIEGRIAFEGTPPKLSPIRDVVCGSTQEKVPDESVVINPNGTLKNVLVYLKDAPPAGKGADRPLVVLDQVGCVYKPHMIALQTGQTLHVLNSDPTIHNVHITSSRNPAKNIAMPSDKDTYDFSFDQPEIFTIKCDVHPWMVCHVGVFDNPFFAVTDESGVFTIKDIPAGTYTLVAHQERLGDMEQTITVTDATPAKATFTYAPPGEK